MKAVEMEPSPSEAHLDLRRLSAADAVQMATLWVQGAEESAQADEAYRPRMDAPGYSQGLAVDLAGHRIKAWGIFSPGQTLLAYLTAEVTWPEPEFVQTPALRLLDLDVHPTARRQGLATRLLKAARELARSEGLASLEVSWLTQDARADAFWRSQGFGPFLQTARSTLVSGT
jgi:GNAT superfamily N-acetyltransferase